MPKEKFQDVERSLSKGELYPVYLVYGDEQHLTNILVDKIRGVFKSETNAEVEQHDAKNIDVISVIDSLKTLPMWTSGRLVIIYNADKLRSKAKELISDYIESFADSSASVLLMIASKFDARSKLYKRVSKFGVTVEASQIYENQMPFWINRECRSKGYVISQEAAHFMTELVGRDLSAMSEAVEKIILYIGSRKAINLDDVETVLSDTSQKSIFDLTNAVGFRDISRASDRLKNLIRNNESPVVVVNMLARHWRLLLKTKELINYGLKDNRQLASKLRVHPFFIKEYISQSAKFTSRGLVNGIKELWEADVKIKSSRLPNESILNKLLVVLVKSN